MQKLHLHRALIRRAGAGTYISAVLMAIFYLFPLYVLLNISFRSIQDTASRLVWPTVTNLGNYISVFRGNDLWIGFKNSIILTVITVTVEIVVSSMAAYGVARSRNRLTRMIGHSSMAIMMIPNVALLVGTYTLMSNLGLINSLWGLGFLLAAGGIPGSIFFYSNFIISIPVALDEASVIDGANTLQTFFYIIMPQLKAVTITRIIMVATGCWNQYLMPLYLLQRKSNQTIILIIKAAFSEFNGVSNVPKACATCVIGIIPIIILYVFLQRFIIEGQLDSATK